MATLEELSDRYEIDNLITAYCHAIDHRDWDALDDIFTEDAIIDYTAAGGAKGDLAAAKRYLVRALEQFVGMQHFAGNTKLVINGDTAEGRTMLFNPMVVEKDGEQAVFFFGASYIDKFRRTENGWRIAHRSEDVNYIHNLPSWFRPVDPDE
ncbi:MAG: nuclear transport factor 2 family protein [Pseudomonadota bacterium]